MRVRFTRDIDGFCAGLSHPRAGSEGDAPKPVAEALVRQRVAVLVETAEAPAVETAAAPAVETGEAPAGEQRRKPGRPRKRED